MSRVNAGGGSCTRRSRLVDCRGSQGPRGGGAGRAGRRVAEGRRMIVQKRSSKTRSIVALTAPPGETYPPADHERDLERTRASRSRPTTSTPRSRSHRLRGALRDHQGVPAAQGPSPGHPRAAASPPAPRAPLLRQPSTLMPYLPPPQAHLHLLALPPEERRPQRAQGPQAVEHRRLDPHGRVQHHAGLRRVPPAHRQQGRVRQAGGEDARAAPRRTAQAERHRRRGDQDPEAPGGEAGRARGLALGEPEERRGGAEVDARFHQLRARRRTSSGLCPALITKQPGTNSSRPACCCLQGG